MKNDVIYSTNILFFHSEDSSTASRQKNLQPLWIPRENDFFSLFHFD